MDLTELKIEETVQVSSTKIIPQESYTVSLETEIPETLYNGMREFIEANPHIDQYGLMSSALANFLYQNGCSDRAVTEKYLNDLFTLSKS